MKSKRLFRTYFRKYVDKGTNVCYYSKKRTDVRMYN